jgi:hypothetical protein
VFKNSEENSSSEFKEVVAACYTKEQSNGLCLLLQRAVYLSGLRFAVDKFVPITQSEVYFQHEDIFDEMVTRIIFSLVT